MKQNCVTIVMGDDRYQGNRDLPRGDKRISETTNVISVVARRRPRSQDFFTFTYGIGGKTKRERKSALMVRRDRYHKLQKPKLKFTEYFY